MANLLLGENINFKDEVDEETKSLIAKMFHEGLNAQDENMTLIDNFHPEQSQMKEIANAAQQVATVELNEEGDIKEMSDGTKYRATKRGWIKVS